MGTDLGDTDGILSRLICPPEKRFVPTIQAFHLDRNDRDIF